MTRQSTEDVSVPDTLADVLRRAAAGVPANPPGLHEVRRRHRKRQLQRSFTALAGVGALVAASVVTPQLLAGPLTPVEPAASADPTPSPATAPPAQRLFISGSGFTTITTYGDYLELPERLDPSLPNFGFPPQSVGVVSLGYQEVAPSGEVVPVDVPSGNTRDFLALEGGRFVTLEWQSLSTAPRRDGPCVTDAALYLRVYESDGTMSLSRDVRVRCDHTTLAGASDTEVYLIRVPHDMQNQLPTDGRRLVAHNLADGTERTVATLDGISPTIRDVNVDAGRVVAVPESGGCVVETLDLARGVVNTLDLGTIVGRCYHLDQVRLSPNGERLAITYATDTHDRPYDVMAAVVDLAGPALALREVADSLPAFEPLDDTIANGASLPRMPASTYAVGLAWTDDATFRVAWVRLPAGLDRLVAIEEVLDVQTYTMP